MASAAVRQDSNATDSRAFEQLWVRDGAWRLSPFVLDILREAKRFYPRAAERGNAPWPSDDESIGQNLTYLFPGHLMKISKVYCRLLGDEQSLNHLTEANQLTVVDLACGPAMASVATIDYLVQLLRSGLLTRRTPLTVSIVLNDLKPACVRAASRILRITKRLVASSGVPLRIGSIESFVGSVLEVAPLFQRSSRSVFHLLCFSNAFDHVLIYGEEALKENPSCSDPIASARPCDRPALLADFFVTLGRYVDPAFSRALFLQEWRYSPLIPIALPSRDLKVIRTRMTQGVYRPDVQEETMPVRFCYCGCQYGYPPDRFSPTPQLLPLPVFDEVESYFTETELMMRVSEIPVFPFV